MNSDMKRRNEIHSQNHIVASRPIWKFCHIQSQTPIIHLPRNHSPRKNFFSANRDVNSDLVGPASGSALRLLVRVPLAVQVATPDH